MPDRPEIRISDAEREQAVQRLNDAVAEGRLTVTEFDDRVAAVLRARTASEVAPHLADLPGAQAPPAVEQADLRATMSNLHRKGRWVLPRRLNVSSKAGSVKLDLTSAVVSHPVLEISLDVYAGSTTLILPAGASVDVDQVESNMVASSVSVRKVPRSPTAVGNPHVVVTGKQWAGSLVVRHQRRFLWWRW